VHFAGRRIDLAGTDFGDSRIARKGACSSNGCRNSGGSAGRSSVGTGGPWDVLLRWMYALESSGCLEQEDFVVVQVLSIGGDDDAVAE
jgi:hypothetical protein